MAMHKACQSHEVASCSVLPWMQVVGREARGAREVRHDVDSSSWGLGL